MPYKRNTNSFSVGLGYDFWQIPIVPSQLDISYRAGSNNNLQGKTEDTLYEIFSNSINVSMTNRLTVAPLRTQFVFSKATQEKESGLLTPTDITSGNLNLFARLEYAFLAEKLIPYVSYRRVSLTGDLAEKSFDYISLGLDARPIQGMNISTGLSQKYQKYTADPNLKNNLLTWNFMISQRF